MRRVKFLLALLPAIILLIYPQNVLAETKTFDSVKDTYANEVYPDNSYGTTGGVVISNKYTTRLGYLWFENINLPEGASLVQGNLKFYVHELHYSDRAKVNLGLVTGEWEETSVTWNSKPTINPTSAIEAEISLASAGWREINITPLVQKWVDGSQKNKGIYIYPLGYLYGTAETEYAFTFRSKEATENKPYLEIEYQFAPTSTPAPTATSTPKTTPPPSASLTPVSETEEVPSPSPEPTEATPTPEAEEGLILGTLSPGQALGGGLIILGGIGVLLGLVLFLRRRKVKKTKEPKEPSSARAAGGTSEGKAETQK